MININAEIQNIIMVFKFDLVNSNFSQDQKDNLFKILNPIDEIDFSVSNPFKALKNLKKAQSILQEYENTYVSYGGNANALEEKLKTMRSQKLKALSEIVKS